MLYVVIETNLKTERRMWHDVMPFGFWVFLPPQKKKNPPKSVLNKYAVYSQVHMLKNKRDREDYDPEQSYKRSLLGERVASGGRRGSSVAIH